MKSFILAAALLGAALPCAAQNVTRRQFTYLNGDITIEVLADMPGTLQVVRGEPGIIDVSSRVPGGLGQAALGGTYEDKLRLSAVGGTQAQFIVSVPEDISLHVVLPNHRSGTVGSMRPGGTFKWAGTASANVGQAQTAPVQPTEPTVGYAGDVAPHTLAVPQLANVSSFTVRLESSSFQVGGNHFMSVANGGSDNVEVRTGTEPEELFVTIPAGTRDFTLKLGGHTALVVRGMEVTTYCEPVTDQTLGDGQRWFTFAPDAGRLSCR